MLAPFLPGIAIGLLKVIAPAAPVKSGGTVDGALRAGSRVTAACVHALRLLLELSVADDVCRAHCPSLLAVASIDGDGGANTRLVAIALGRPLSSAAAPQARAAPETPPGSQTLGPNDAAWWSATGARLGQVLRMLSSHVAQLVLDPPPALGVALLILFDAVLSRCTSTLRSAAPAAVACALLVHARLGPAAGPRSSAIERAASEMCAGPLAGAALAAALCRLPLALLAHRECFADDFVLDMAAKRMRDLPSATANAASAASLRSGNAAAAGEHSSDDLAAACAVWAALGQSPSELMRLAALQLEAAASGAGLLEINSGAGVPAIVLRSVVLIWSRATDRNDLDALEPERATAECLADLLLRALRLVPLARLHLVPAAAGVAAGEADPPFLAAADTEALHDRELQAAASSSPFSVSALGASATVRPQNGALVGALTSLLRALSVAALGASGSLAHIEILVDACSSPLSAEGPAGADVPSEHLLAGLSDAEAAAEPALRPHWRTVQALWLGHRLLAASSDEFSASVGRFLDLRVSSRAHCRAAGAATAEAQAAALREAREWASCVAGGSKALVEAAVGTLSLRLARRETSGSGYVRSWLELAHMQAARALASAAASCGRAFDGFAARVLPLLLARALEAGPAGSGAAPVGDAICEAPLPLAAAATGPSPALSEARERLLPLPRPVRARQSPRRSAARAGVEAYGAAPGLALQLQRGSLAIAAAGNLLARTLPEGLSALLSAHASGLADVTILHLRGVADLARRGAVDACAVARLAHAPRVAALLVVNAASAHKGDKIGQAALLPLLQDVSTAATEALRALSASTPALGHSQDNVRGDLVVALVQTLDAVISSVSILGISSTEEGAEAPPACVSSDMFDEAPRLRGVAGRLCAARSARAVRAVSKLPFLPLGARDVVVRALLAAGEHLSAAAAAFGSSGAAAEAPPAWTSRSMQSLRVTIAALHAVMSGCEALARHPETLNPVLHIVWPAVVALLPPANFAAQALAAAQARAQASAQATGGRLAADEAAKELGSAAPLGSAVSAVVSTWSRPREDLGPDIAVGAPTLLDMTRDFMVRRAAALGEARRNSGSGLASGQNSSSGRPATRFVETRRVGLPANVDDDAPYHHSQFGAGVLVVELESVATGGEASEGGAAAIAARDASPSALTLLVHSAALELVASLAAAPELVPGGGSGGGRGGGGRRGGGRGGLRGACAGAFLRARFASDVWPRLRSVLLACSVRLRREGPAAEEACSGHIPTRRGSLPSAQKRLFIAALECVRRLGGPTVTVTLAPEAEDSNGGCAAPLSAPLPPPPTVVRAEPSLLVVGPTLGFLFECTALVAMCGSEDEDGGALVADAAIAALRALQSADAHTVSAADLL
jgi:hypothetical protein